MNLPTADQFSRTALLNLHDDRYADVAAALDAHRDTGVIIVAGAEVCATHGGQAALCTAIATAVRAFGTVAVSAPADVVLTGGPHRGATISSMIAAEGAQLIDDTVTLPLSWPTLLLGAAPGPQFHPRGNGQVLEIGWSGWTARVRPATSSRPPATDGNVLSAIAAAAIGVHEAFGILRDRPGSDAGYRTVELNLWAPNSDSNDGPALTYAPAAWWLVGLGHLGQANAWSLSWMNYADPEHVRVVLQDAERIVEANHSTGVLTPIKTAGMRKTRLVAAVLDKIGYDTQLIERNLDPQQRTTAADYHVALVGVDNLAARRLISAVGWPLTIDIGLGRGPGDFNAISLHTFPGARRSDQILSWVDEPAATHRTDTAALADLVRQDPCGGVEVAGKAVGAAFVGVTAGCLAIAEAVRAAVGGPRHEALSFHMQSSILDHGPATVPADVLSLKVLD